MKTEPTEGPSYILSCLLQWWMIRQKIEDHKKLRVMYLIVYPAS